MNGAPANPMTPAFPSSSRPDRSDGVQGEGDACRIERQERRHVGRRADGSVDDRPDLRLDPQPDAHRLERQHDVGEEDRGIDAELADRHERDLGAEVGRLGELEDPVPLTELAVGGERTPGLAHEPDRRRVHRFAPARAQESIAHAPSSARISSSGRWTPSRMGVIADGRTAALGRTQRPHQVAERDQVVGLVGDHEILVVEAERVGQRLSNGRVSVPDLHVLVHDRLPGLAALEVPVGALGEGVDDQVARPLAAEERLLLGRRLADVLRRPDAPDQRVLDGQPAPEPGTQEAGSRRLPEGRPMAPCARTARRRPPPGRSTNRRCSGAPAAAGRRQFRRLGKGRASYRRSSSGRPPPGRIEAERHRLDVGLLAVSGKRFVGRVLAHRSHAAMSAAAYVITIPAPARTIAVTASIIARRPSSQPRSAAAASIAYSPETW